MCCLPGGARTCFSDVDPWWEDILQEVTRKSRHYDYLMKSFMRAAIGQGDLEVPAPSMRFLISYR